MDLENHSDQQLLRLIAQITLELRNRGVIRTNNTLGDYAEYLVCKAIGLTLTQGSKKGIDAIDKLGKTYQIKARRVSARTSTPTIKSLRSFEFDFLILVLFNEDYSIKFCGKLTSELALELSSSNPRVNARRLSFSKKLRSDPRIEVLDIETTVME